MSFNKTYLSVIAVLGWFALIAQLYLSIDNRIVPIPATLLRFFTYFTILVNILVTACCTTLVSPKPGPMTDFFSRPGVLTAITVYITVVGLVYNIILRQLWDPHGLQMFVDEILHTVIPLLFLFFWIIWVPKTPLKLIMIPGWLIFPAVYAVLVLILGKLTGHYPYPFLNVNELGFTRVVRNSGWLVLLFLIFSLLTMALASIHRKRQA